MRKFRHTAGFVDNSYCQLNSNTEAFRNSNGLHFLHYLLLENHAHRYWTVPNINRRSTQGERTCNFFSLRAPRLSLKRFLQARLSSSFIRGFIISDEIEDSQRFNINRQHLNEKFVLSACTIRRLIYQQGQSKECSVESQCILRGKFGIHNRIGGWRFPRTHPLSPMEQV